MKVTAKTAFSGVLREDPSIVEALVKVAPSFKRLRNPFLKTIISPFITIENAPKIFGAPAMQIYKALHKAGFEIDNKLYCPTCDDDEEEERDFEKVVDIRATERKGMDENVKIFSELSGLRLNETLLIISSTELSSITTQTNSAGFEMELVRKSDSLVYTYFKKVGDSYSS